MVREQSVCQDRLAILESALREYEWGGREVSMHSVVPTRGFIGSDLVAMWVMIVCYVVV